MADNGVKKGSFNIWVSLACEAASLGERGIKEYLIETGVLNDVTPTTVTAQAQPVFDAFLDCVRPTFEVTVTYSRENETGCFMFSIVQPEPHATYEKAVEAIAAQQVGEKAKGLPHNVDAFMDGKIREVVAKVTGYTINPGDLWMHVLDNDTAVDSSVLRCGLVSFGAITRAGEIAIQKYRRVQAEERIANLKQKINDAGWMHGK